MIMFNITIGNIAVSGGWSLQKLESTKEWMNKFTACCMCVWK